MVEATPVAAPALTVPDLDSTFGGSAANSYLTVAQADSFFSTTPHFDAFWAALTSGLAGQRSQRLQEATRAIDRLHYKFGRFDTTTPQSLLFPVWDKDGGGLASIYLQEVQDATCQMLLVLNRQRSSTTGKQTRLQKKVDVKDKVAVEYADQTAQSNDMDSASEVTLATVKDTLKRWIQSGNSFTIMR